MAAVSQILFRTPVSAVNKDDHLRVYSQDVYGSIRESLFESGWQNGGPKNVIAQGKIGTPISATSQALNEIRVYYISNDNKLREVAYSSDRGWYNGDLNSKNFSVAPYSKVAATFLPRDGQVLRVYAQKEDDTIQEYVYDSPKSGWVQGANLGAALPGSALAATSYKAAELGIRVYTQGTDLKISEKAYDESKGWYTGGLSFSAPPRTSLSTTSFNASSSGISIRVYYGETKNGNEVREKAWDGSGGWYDGGFAQPSIAGTDSSVIAWDKGSNLQLRVYFQNGTAVTGVSEWVFSKSWTKGVPAIPPA